MVDAVIVPQQLELVWQVLNRCAALVRVNVPFRLLREPTLLVRRVDPHHVALVARELRTVPRRVQPCEDLVVARALVSRMFDDRVALDKVKGESRREQGHPAAGERMQRLHEVGRDHGHADHRETEDKLGHPRAREGPAIVPRMREPEPTPRNRVLHVERGADVFELLAGRRDGHVWHQLQLARHLDVKGRLQSNVDVRKDQVPALAMAKAGV
mmetsp:Transcript_32256/g.75187  ORF Transcript_32256/g.75187 Transcript_32256/m.75187 type:complete len:213 (-) Transcript_32256:11-649(-)